MVSNSFFEKTLEQMVFERRDTIHERGLDVFYKHTKRQVMLNKKRIDMLTWEVRDDVIYARIIEFKRDALSRDCLFQALGYYSDFVGSLMGHFKDYHVEIILIGTQSCSNLNLAMYLTDILFLYEYKYDFDGIVFKKVGNSAQTVKDFFKSYKNNELSEDYKSFCDKLKAGV